MRTGIVVSLALVTLICSCEKGDQADSGVKAFIDALEALPVGAVLDSYNPAMTEEVPKPISSSGQAAREFRSYLERHELLAEANCSKVQESKNFYFMEVRPRRAGTGMAIIYVQKNARRIMVFNHR